MNRVEIRDLYDEIAHDYDESKYALVRKVEIVPRKLIEMLIDYFKCEMEKENTLAEEYPEYYAYHQGKFNALCDAQLYAESLLEEFEEEDE